MVRPWAQEAHSTTDLPPSCEDLDHDDVELPELPDLAHVVLGVEHLEVAPQENPVLYVLRLRRGGLIRPPT